MIYLYTYNILLCYLVKYIFGILSFEIFHFYIQIKLVYNGFNVYWVRTSASTRI